MLRYFNAFCIFYIVFFYCIFRNNEFLFGFNIGGASAKKKIFSQIHREKMMKKHFQKLLSIKKVLQIVKWVLNFIKLDLTRYSRPYKLV